MSGDIGDASAGPWAQPWAQSIRLAFRTIFAIVLVAALAWPFSNIHEISADSRAVVLRLGRVVRVQGAGLLLAWPRPVERVVLLPASERQLEFAVGPLQPPPGDASPSWAVSDDARQNAAFFMTGDGVVHLTATLFYRIVEPADYMLQAAHIPPALTALTMASLVSLAAARDTDTLVVTRGGADLATGDSVRRERLRGDLVAAINHRLDGLRTQGMGLGVAISRVDLVTALPNEAKVAFEEVLIAGQQADAAIAEARSDAARVEQQGQKDANALIDGARAAGAERESTATSHTASVRSLAQTAGGTGGAALLDRLYYDRIQAILRQAGSVTAFDTASGARLLLPEQAP